MIDLKKDEKQIEKNAELCARQDIILPTYRQMAEPSLVPDNIKKELKNIGRDDVHSRNLFRVTWENEPVEKGGLYTGVNYLEIPSEITGIRARVIGLVGKYFPTGAHKVGAAYSCLAPTLITGQFDPEKNMAVWPSTGNYCRGGAYISRLLACKSIAILPEEMSRERFNWLEKMADRTIATPGSESNVKEIFDKCHELDDEYGSGIFIFNQFDQMPNPLWHYRVTGPAMQKVFKQEAAPNQRFAGICLSSGSGGTLGAGAYIKEQYHDAVLAVGEALQCPTLLSNGFGAHRIEGIGDKHVPWVHNVKDTDMVAAIDDELTMRLLRLFNEPDGLDYLAGNGVPEETARKLGLLGISSIGNLMTTIKMAKYYEMTEDDVIFTVFTDSEAMYTSRLKELTRERGAYSRDQAIADYQMLMSVGTDALLELTYTEKKRIHNLKYYTWIEQQGKTVEELNAQWHQRNYWESIYEAADRIDPMIEEFNKMVESFR